MALRPISIPARSWSLSMFTSGLPFKVALPRDESAPWIQRPGDALGYGGLLL